MRTRAALTDRLVVCVDLGTACSGYVIKEPTMEATDTLDFNAPGMGTSLVKTPSDVAFELVGGRLKPGSAVIGRKALKCAADEGPDAAHFSRYKMRLYDDTIRTSTSTTVRTSTGEEYPLLTVIGTALELIRAETVQRVIKMGYNVHEIHWVVTVPAMARDEQLAFMRRAAVEAGMVLTPDSERLTLAAEPEAACAYMLTQPMMANVRVGETIAVLDCGGGTHDFVALRILSRVPFRAEFVSESEGGVGGAADINEAFYRAVSLLVSCGENDRMFQNTPDVIAELWEIAEAAKRHLNEAPDEAMLFDLGFLADCECVERANFNACVDAFNARAGYVAIEKPSGRRMRVRFAARFFRELVLNAVHPIERLARGFLARTRVDHVVVVGGFAESRLLREHLQAVAGTRRLLVPPNPSTCVARGGMALMSAQISRICRFTYGLEVSKPWSSRYDVPGAIKKTNTDGAKRCSNAFHTNIKRGTIIQPGWRSKENVYWPAGSHSSHISFVVYRSTEAKPLTTVGQESVGKLTIDVDEKTRYLPRKEQEFAVSWTWEKEIVMIVTRLRDGHQWRMCIDV